MNTVRLGRYAWRVDPVSQMLPQEVASANAERYRYRNQVWNFSNIYAVTGRFSFGAAAQESGIVHTLRSGRHLIRLPFSADV
jgi:hypothetical protein